MVKNTEDEIVITKNGTPAALLISSDEFGSMKETLAVRSDPQFMEEIKKGLTDLKKKRTDLYTLEELFG
jgi:antitoxin YefM